MDDITARVLKAVAGSEKSERAIAKESGVSSTTILFWRGGSEPGVRKLAAVAGAVGLRISVSKSKKR